jgi:hypothetical protein
MIETDRSAKQVKRASQIERTQWLRVLDLGVNWNEVHANRLLKPSGTNRFVSMP